MPAPTLSAVIARLNHWFDFAAFPDDAGNGLVVGDTFQPVARVGYAVNCSWEVIEDAIRQKADFLLTHHAAWDEIEGENAVRKRGALREAGIAHFVCHLPLDCDDDDGTAATLCHLLGIPREGRFAEVGDGHFGGRWGSLPRPITFNAFVARLSDALGVVPYTMLGTATVHRVAIVTGAGGDTDLLEEARALGCDTYVTGEGGLYTKLYARETGLNLLLGTHTATERPGIERLAQRLQSALPGLDIMGLRETPFE